MHIITNYELLTLVTVCSLTHLNSSEQFGIPIYTSRDGFFVERRTRDRKVASSNPGRSGGRISFPSVNFVFSSVHCLDRLDRRGDMREDSAEILFQSFLQEAVSSSGMGRDVHPLMLSLQHFLCRPRRRPLCVLTLIRCSFHPRVTAVARKRPRSLCQKCILDQTKSEWVNYAAVQA